MLLLTYYLVHRFIRPPIPIATVRYLSHDHFLLQKVLTLPLVHLKFKLQSLVLDFNNFYFHIFFLILQHPLQLLVFLEELADFLRAFFNIFSQFLVQPFSLFIYLQDFCVLLLELILPLNQIFIFILEQISLIFKSIILLSQHFFSTFKFSSFFFEL